VLFIWTSGTVWDMHTNQTCNISRDNLLRDFIAAGKTTINYNLLYRFGRIDPPEQERHDYARNKCHWMSGLGAYQSFQGAYIYLLPAVPGCNMFAC
jgi:hypothetical protein